MCCIGEIVISIFGLVILITGKMAVSGSRYVYGVPARVAGAILAATFPLALGGGFVLGFYVALNDPKAAQAGNLGSLQMMGLVIDIAVVVVCLGGGLGVAFAYSEPKRKPKLNLDDAYDEPFRSRRRDDRDDRDYRDEPRRDDGGITDRPDDMPPPRPPDDRIQD